MMDRDGRPGSFNGIPTDVPAEIRELKPLVLVRFSCVLSFGRRKSASTSSTRNPCWANAAAQLMLVVVLPSSGKALVINRTLHSALRIDCMIDVRSPRYASAA